MARQISFAVLLFLILVFSSFYLKAFVINVQDVRDDVPVWPYPVDYRDTSAGASIVLDPTRFTYVLKSQSGATLDITKYPILDQATKRYVKVIFAHEIDPQVNATGSQAFVVTINLNNGSEQPLVPEPLQAGVDMIEEYGLRVGTDFTCVIDANSQWGVLRALETLSQLVYFEQDLENFRIDKLPILINDKPRFIWRGLMIDTARHFLTMDTIKTIIDGMSYDKLNVLHVHWIDAQSIPIVVNKFPLFGEKARWHKSMYYTQDDMREVVDYCFKRGIVVVPEFDLPGHAYVWGNSYPEARSTCSQFKPPVNINNFPIQPANNITYDIIEAMLGDMSSIFTNDMIHLGGDELVLSCWQNDETVKKFLQQRPDIKSMYDLWGYFQSRLEPLYRQNKKRMICWEELLLNLHTSFYSVPKDTIVQVWELIDHLQKVVEDRGYQAVLSAGFYLDKQKPDPSMRDRHLWVDVWEDMYLVDPFKNITTEAGRNRVLGIEACQWGEQVDISQITNRIWARASGVAERAWSPATIVDTVKARTRLINHRCQVFAKRGIMTTPIRPDYCPYVQPMKRYNHDKLVLPQVVRK